MKTQCLLAASLASVCLFVSGDLPRPVLAQQDTPTRHTFAQQDTLSPRIPHVTWEAQSLHSSFQDGVTLTTLQGDVKLKSFGGMPITITNESGFLVFKLPTTPPRVLKSSMLSAPVPGVIEVPMDFATMKVSVTAMGTVFEDAKNDKVTVTLHPLP